MMTKHFINNKKSNFDAQAEGVAPGDEIVISGNRGSLTISNITGTEKQPVIVCADAPLTIDADQNWVGLWLKTCRHVKLWGKGMHITNSSNVGLNVTHGSTYTWIDGLEISNVGGAGISLKTTAKQGYSRADFTQRDSIISNCYLHNTGREGIYLGSSKYFEGDDPVLKGVQVYNNLTRDTGWDGLQIGSAVAGVIVHHNHISNTSQKMTKWQMNGMIANPACGDWFDNVILNAMGNGAYLTTVGTLRFFRNYINNVGYGIPSEGDKVSRSGVHVDSNGISVIDNTILDFFNKAIAGGYDFEERGNVTSADDPITTGLNLDIANGEQLNRIETTLKNIKNAIEKPRQFVGYTV